MAGRLVFFWTMVFALAAVSGAASLAQGVQTPSATLETVISLVEQSPYVSEKQAAVLSTFFAAAVEQGALTPDQALALLGVVGWGELEEDGAGFAVRALELALMALTAGDAPYDEVLSALSQAAESGELGPMVSGNEAALPGIFTSLMGPAEEMSVNFWVEVEELVFSGLPPGIVARTARQLLRSGASEEEVLTAVESLAEGVAEGLPPGKANASSPGNKYREKAENQNHAQGAPPGPQLEAEQQRHGPPPDRGKPDDEEEEGQGRGRGKKG